MATKKSKSKQWVSIMAPKFFGEVEIGKTFATEPDYIIGRKIITNAMNVVNDLDKFYMKLIFTISSINGTKALTEFTGSQLMSEYITRLVLRRVRRTDLVQDLMTKDGVKVRVKSIILTSKKISTATKFDVTNMIREMIQKTVENSTLEQFVEDVISDEIKMKVLQEARKIYPVRYFELRRTEVIKQTSSEPKQQKD